MDIALIINLVITGLMSLILLISVISGLISGMKKSLFNGIYNLVLVVLLLIFTSSITSFILNLDLSGLNININGTTLTTLNNFAISMLESNETIGNFMASSPESTELILKLPVILATPIIFTVLFWVLKLVLSLLFSILSLLYLILIKPFIKKKKKEKLDNRGRVIKPKKHRLVGALIGLASGLVIIFATFTPVFGIGEVLNKLNKINVDENGNFIVAPSSLTLYAEEPLLENETKTLLESLIGSEGLIYFNAYNNSVGIQISKAIGIETLGYKAFNNLSTSKINGVEIKLIDEINGAVLIVNDVNTISTLFNKEQLSQQELTLLLTSCENFVNNTFNLNVVKAIGASLLSPIIDDILNNPNSSIKLPEEITKDEIKNLIVTEALKSIKDYQVENIKQILVSLINVLQVVNDNELLLPVYNNLKKGEDINFEDLLTSLKETDSTIGTDIANCITEIPLIEDLSPLIIDTSLDYGFKFMELQYSSNNISETKALETIQTLVSNAINGLKTINLSTKFYVTTESFEYIGNILNLIKDPAILTNIQYENVLDYAQNQLQAFNLPIDLTTVINNLDNVSNWKDEVTKIGLVYNDFMSIYNSIENINKIDFTTLNLATFGTILNQLETTTIFNNAIIPIYNDIIETTKTSLTDFSGALNTLKIDVATSNINWENEFTAIKPLITKILEFKNVSFTNKESALKLLEICEEFDIVENNSNAPVYSSKMAQLFIEVIKIAKDISGDSNIDNLCDNVITNINARPNNKTLRLCVLEEVFNYASSFIPEANSFSDTNIQAMITEIKTKITQIQNKQIEADLEEEFGYMLSFADLTEKLQDFSNLSNDEITELSNKLEKLSESKIFKNTKSHIINLIIDTAKNAITDDDLNIKPLLNNLKNNITVSINTLLSDLDIIKQQANKLTGLDDISSLNTSEVAGALNAIKNTNTFTYTFANEIMKNVLDKANSDAQNNEYLPPYKKTEINNFITNTKANLSGESDYEEILNNLKNILTTL